MVQLCEDEVGNFVRAAEPLVDWVSDCICYVRDHQLTRIAPTPEAEAAWIQHVAEAGAKILRTQADSWFVGANIPGKARERAKTRAEERRITVPYRPATRWSIAAVRRISALTARPSTTSGS